MNLYRGCTHNCLYCDGRSEKYNVEGEFGSEVEVKVNAIELLKKELRPKRTHLKRGYIMLGGGVGDSYQPVEKKYELTKKALNLIYENNFPVSALTKSTLIERDFDIFKKINERSRSIVSFSFSSADDEISSIFEPGVPTPSERLETLKMFKKEGIATGMFLMPVIPFITDKPKILEDTIKKAKDVGVDFIIFSGMTLKNGRQMDYFYDNLKKNYPDLLVDYCNIYPGHDYGHATDEYYESIHTTFDFFAKKYKIAKRMPPYLYSDILDKNDLVIVMLEQIDYLLKFKGKKSPYGFAAYSISKLTEPLYNMKNKLQTLKGVGPTTERLILEILETGKSPYLEKLLYN